MSEVEQLYVKISEQQGGNTPWQELPSQTQHIFTQAVNAILQIANLRKP